MIRPLLYTCFFFIFLRAGLSAQTIPITDNSIAQTYSFVRPVFNMILQPGGLDSFYDKLHALKTSGQGRVSIVHIGDSHIQADFLSGVVRTGLQDFFGNAGRGLVFPYQLARSNAPADIISSSNTSWQFNRAAHPEIAINYGISGYGIKSGVPNAAFNLSLKPSGDSPQIFDRLKFFLDNNTWTLRAASSDSSFQTDSLYTEIALGEKISGFSLSAAAAENATEREFYGVSLENSSAGVLYHMIGVNGARYDHYNEAALFWKQLAALEADLVIVSLGTNEAQASSFNEKNFREQFDMFIKKLKAVSPNAAVLITTAADSYKHRKPNALLKQINSSLARYCEAGSIPFWDLYRISNGYGSAHHWYRRKLMSRDRIHFTAEGYRVQGRLLLNALAKGYNGYISLK